MLSTLKKAVEHKCLALALCSLLASCGGGGGSGVSTIDTSVIPVAIDPVSSTVAVTNQKMFTASGGTGPYSYAIFSGSGSILQSTGNFTAAGVPGTAVVRVTDSAGGFADAVISINAALAVSPLSPSLNINDTLSFSVSGGVSPFAYMLISGAGAIDPTTGIYTAPAVASSDSIRVTDALGNNVDVTVSVFSALGISPAAVTLAVNNSYLFSAAGGGAPYTFAVLSGSGSVSAAGAFTAGVSSGSTVVQVTDNLGATANATVTVNSALSISPANLTAFVNTSFNFSEAGGVSPHSYSLVSGVGAINSSTGLFTAPSVNGAAVVRVTDAVGNFSNSNVIITTPLSISPQSGTLAINNTLSFSSVGGTGPFVYSMQSGSGSIHNSSGVYTGPAVPGVAVIRVTDSLGAFAQANVNINAGLAISPASQSMTVNGDLTFTASGGVAPYSFSIITGAGAINSVSGAFTAPASAGSVLVRVVDSLGNSADSSVTVSAGLGISPASVTLAVNNIINFSGSSGAPPYVFSLVSGAGAINSSTGQYTAAASSGPASVRVTDSLGFQATANITVNPALAINPATKTVAVNNSFTFTSTGGVSPLMYSITSGSGSINSSTGAFTAAANGGTATVQVTDGLGNISIATVAINSALNITPSSFLIAVPGTKSFSASGGVSPYVYSIITGPGSINSASGVYTSTGAGSVIIRVTDSMNNTSDGTLDVNAALSASPTSATVIAGSVFIAIAADGVPPYAYSVVAGAGSIDSISGEYSASGVTGSATLRITDAVASTADVAVTIVDPLSISPNSLLLATSSSQTFAAVGGVGARTFSMASGLGSIHSTSGVYTSSTAAGADVILVTDTAGKSVSVAIAIVNQLSISPMTLKLPVSSTIPYISILGTNPKTFTVVSGTGAVNLTTGIYTAPATAGVGSVRVTDLIMTTATATVTHIEPVEISSGASHTCVRYNEGSVKCFGDGSFGQLGDGSSTDLSDAIAEVGGTVPFVNLGTGRTALAIATGAYHSCALLDNSSLKCWGHNSFGQLGIGSANRRGDSSGEMGDNLPAANVGVGRTVSKVFAFGFQTCVVLDNSVTKCFGKNSFGQLGLDDSLNRGTVTSQMGDSLAAVNLGVGRTPVKITGGSDFTCALLDNASVKCFGVNNFGQLGLENTESKGDNAGEMAALTSINLGSGRTASDLSSGKSHVCVVLDNGLIKCWGQNTQGELGHGDTLTCGVSANQMGDSLPSSTLTGFVAVKIYAGNKFTCAQNVSGAVRCWGANSEGQLLIGNVSSQGDNASEMAALINVNLGSGLSGSLLSLGKFHACALLTNKRIKCWGSAADGSLGNGTVAPNLGVAAGELGDGLPFVNH